MMPPSIHPGPGESELRTRLSRLVEAFGRPRNPDHLLRSGELLESMRGHLKVLAYEQCLQDRPSRRVMQHIVAMRET